MKNIIRLSCILLLLAFTGASGKYEVKNNELILPYPIVFKPGTAELSSESDSALNYIKGYLDEKTFITKIRIEGHTDNSSDVNISQALSEKRAMAVGKRLVEMNVDCKRIICVGFGSSKPIADNATPEGKASNNRISVMNAALRNVPIGGMPIDGEGKVAGDVCGR